MSSLATSTSQITASQYEPSTLLFTSNTSQKSQCSKCLRAPREPLLARGALEQARGGEAQEPRSKAEDEELISKAEGEELELVELQVWGLQWVEWAGEEEWG